MIQRMVWANLRHRRMRTALAVSAIALEMAMILLIFGLADGLVGEATRRQRGIGADIMVRPNTSGSALSAGSAGLDEAMVGEIEALPGVKMAVGTAFSLISGINTITGVDIAKLDRMAGGLDYLKGRAFEQPFEAVIDEYYARQGNLDVGDTVSFLNRDFTVSGIVGAGKASRIFIPLATKQEISSEAGKLSQIYVQLEDPSQAVAFVETLKARYPENPIYTMEEFISLFTSQTRGMADEFVDVIVGIAMGVGFIVVLIAMYTAVLDRTREIGILKALGASPGYVVRIFLGETALLTVAGIVAGIGIAYLAASLLENRFPLVTVTILESHLVRGTGVALIGSLLGVLYPSLRAARQDPIEALAYE
ncbi:MAG TPA: ABC transporter permease [Bryobacterales bacterium]|nr:ABC transporter permease [Bryobacterales bacterium]